MRRRAAALVLFAAGALAGLAAPAGAAGQIVAGSDFVRLLPPTGAAIEPYRNAGYQLDFRGGGVEIRVDVAPLGSGARFALPATPSGDRIGRVAREITRGATTRYEAVGRVLSWIRTEITYSLDRGASQEPEAVMARRSAYCAGTARLAVALLAAVGIEAREVPGYVLVPLAGGEIVPGFHRWIEVHYPDRGWVFSDPLASQQFVPATYLRLASESLASDPSPGRLLERRSALAAIDLAPAAPPGVQVRANGTERLAAALVVRSAAAGEATLSGAGGDRRQTLVDGEARFLGLATGRYELKVHRDGRLAAWKRLTFRAPVLAELVIPAGAVPAGAGGGR